MLHSSFTGLEIKKIEINTLTVKYAWYQHNFPFKNREARARLDFSF